MIAARRCVRRTRFHCSVSMFYALHQDQRLQRCIWPAACCPSSIPPLRVLSCISSRSDTSLPCLSNDARCRSVPIASAHSLQFNHCYAVREVRGHQGSLWAAGGEADRRHGRVPSTRVEQR